MNSRKEEVGITQLCSVDQCPPPSGIGGRASILDGNPYILRNVSSKVVLHVWNGGIAIIVSIILKLAKTPLVI